MKNLGISYQSNKIVTFSTEFFKECRDGISRWLEKVSEIKINDDDLFFELAHRLIFIKYEDNDKNHGYNYLAQALNHWIGITTTALLNWIVKKSPTDNSLIHDSVRKIFTEICKNKEHRFINGKIILGRDIVFLYRVDPVWAEKELLPLFNWNSDENIAASVWQGFYWSPKLFIELLEKLKNPFLNTVNYFDRIGVEASNNFVRVITHLGLYRPKFLTVKEIQDIFSLFEIEQLIIVSDYIRNQVKINEEIENQWSKIFYSFFHQIWPKSKEFKNEKISENFALMCIEAKGMFKIIYETIQFYLSPIKNPGYILMELQRKKLCENDAELILSLLSSIIVNKSKPFINSSLSSCLNSIIQHNANLENNPKYLKLLRISN